MFNHEAYQRRLDELKENVRTWLLTLSQDEQGKWSKDVSLRYGRFLATRTQEQLQRTIDLFPGYEHVDDKQKHRDYCAAELMGVVAGLHASSALIRGAVLTSDPIGAQAMMMIYEEANTPDGHTYCAAPPKMAKPTEATEEQLAAFITALRKGPCHAVIVDKQDDATFEAPGFTPFAND